MARVDRAELVDGTGPPRPVALKRMLPHVAASEEMVQAFVREARLMSYLRHVNIAQTYEYGQVEDIHFIAMELVTGPTLRAVLKHCAQTTGPMPVPFALNILNQLCDALDYAHNLRDEHGKPLGIIHRDVSPSNLIIDHAGAAKLIDFGIAKSQAGAQTVAGVIKGKFGYMAPEYLAGSIDARADLFAVGVIAHELLTNRPLFTVADDMETMRRMRTMTVQPPSQRNPNVPPDIDGIVMTALERDPAQRWQHATALRTAMTTLTKRLGAVCSNRQVIEWIAWAFEQSGRPSAAVEEPSMAPIELSYSNLEIESPTHAEPAAARAVAAARAAPEPRPRSPSSIEQTLRMSGSGAPSLPGAWPSGTPPRTSSAQDATFLSGDSFTIPDATEVRPPSDSITHSITLSDALSEPTAARAPGDAVSVGGEHGSTLLGPGAAVHARAAARLSRPNLSLDGGSPSRSPSVPPSSEGPPPRSPSTPQIPLPQAAVSLPPVRPAQSPPDHDLAEPLPPPPLREPAPGAAAPHLSALFNAKPARRSRTLTILIVVLLAAGLAAIGVYLVLHLPA